MRRPRTPSLQVQASGVQAELNTTPLIDVLLVLLVMLILTMPTLTHLTTLETPAARPSRGTPPAAVWLEIDFDGRIYWNGEAVADLAALEPRLARLAAGASPQPPLRVVADRRAKYEQVAQVLAAAQRIGIVNLGLAPIEGD